MPRLLSLLLALALACTGRIGDAGRGPSGEPGRDDPADPSSPPADEPLPPTLPPADACADVDPDPGPGVLRRLTHEEYAATIQAELGVDVTELLVDLPPDPRAYGFTNNAKTLIVGVELAEAYLEIAEATVARADLGAVVARHASCADLSADCAAEVARALGERLFRGPVDDAQVARFAALFEVVREEGDDFETAAGLVLSAMLTSPAFLYRLEETPDAVRPVSAHALATRLAYFLWGAPPDDALLDAAARGLLDDPDALEAEARRLLDDPRARARSERFFEDWFSLAKVPGLTLPEARYPAFDDALAAAMREESMRFLQDLAWESRAPMEELYTAEHTFLNPRLAELYGLEPTGEGWQRYSLEALPERRGLLTQPGVLAVHAHGAEPSIVHRGLFVLTDVLCDAVPPPPPGVDATPPELAPGTAQRDASEQRVGSATCGGCHSRFDPIAYAFDRFDAAGAFRDEDAHGNALSSDGALHAPDGTITSFADAGELAEVLAASPRARSCVVRKATQFALGRPLVAADACTVSEVLDDYESRGGRYEDLMLAIVTHPSFRLIGPSDDMEVAP